MEQRTDEWYLVRAGKVTASNVYKVLSKGKGGADSKTRLSYMLELLGDRMEGCPVAGYQSEAMARGSELEPEARDVYSFETGNIVDETGFVPHPKIKGFGASPDGLVEDDGLVEIKCPNRATHIDTLVNGTIDNKYYLQMQTQLACTGRKWCDFVSYYPALGENSLFIKRIEADQALISEMEQAVIKFLNELDALERRINEPNNSNR